MKYRLGSRTIQATLILCMTMTVAAFDMPQEEPEEIVTIEEDELPLADIVDPYDYPIEFEWDYEDTVEFIDPVRMRVTCYVPTGNPTASGVMPFEGMCAAKREWIGKVAILYDEDMKYVGVFEILDTGGHERITSGKSIDVFRDSIESAHAWIDEHGDYMYCQIVDAKG